MEKLSQVNLMIRTAIIVSIMGLLVFIPAGTFSWIEAWINILIVLFIFEAMVIYFWRYDRELIQSRGSINKPTEKWDILLYALLMISMISILIVAGLDYRFELSTIPEFFRYSAITLVIAGLLIYFFVMKENTYLSKVVEIQEEQKVISTGPYSVVRHPLYAGNSLIFIGVSISLGSYFALIITIIVIILFAIRSVLEERIMMKELPRYLTYKNKVKYRMIPFVW